MAITTRTRITFENVSRSTVRLRRCTVISCDRCTDSQMLMLADAALFFRLPQLEVYRRLESGDVHFIESTGGVLFVCQKTLA